MRPLQSSGQDPGLPVFYCCFNRRYFCSYLEQADKIYTGGANRQNLLSLDAKLTDPFALKLLKATDAFVVKMWRTYSGVQALKKNCVYCL